MMQLVIGAAGQIRCLYSEAIALQALGTLEIRRASHVEPAKDSRWTADLAPVGGPILGPFDDRSSALAAETRWIERLLEGEVSKARELAR